MWPCKKCQSDKKFAQNTPNPLLKLESLFLAVGIIFSSKW